VKRYLPLAGILVLNVLDAILSLIFIKNTPYIEEGNLLLRELLGTNTLMFALVKISLASLGVLILKKFWEEPGVQIASVLLCGVYCGVVLSFCWYMFQS
jgi:hypothetical protein